MAKFFIPVFSCAALVVVLALLDTTVTAQQTATATAARRLAPGISFPSAAEPRRLDPPSITSAVENKLSVNDGASKKQSGVPVVRPSVGSGAAADAEAETQQLEESFGEPQPDEEAAAGTSSRRRGSTSNSSTTGTKVKFQTISGSSPLDCECKQAKGDFVVCSGRSCTSLPSGLFVPSGRLRIIRTNITQLVPGMFTSLTNLVQLDIRSNPSLSKILPGTFDDLSMLGNLTLSFNKLSKLDPESFRGLTNLEEVFLVQNRIQSLKVVAAALRPQVVPNLYHVHLGGNNFGEVKEDDLAPLAGSNIKDFQLMACNIKKIEPKALTQLTSLGRLRLKENIIPVDTLVEVIKNLPPSLYALDISAMGLTADDMPKIFGALADSKVTDLWLVKNNIPVLKPGAVPVSPNMVRLNLRDVGAFQLEAGALSNFTNLEELYLAGNKFSELPLGALLPSLKTLDLSMNSGDSETPRTRAFFNLGTSMFSNMQSLNKLRLKGNDIVKITERTFTGLKNLTLLDLESCKISRIEPRSFSDLRSLETLLLQKNDLSSLVSQSNKASKDIFKGLESLKTLRLDHCRVESIHSDTFLGETLPALKTINLDGNRLTTFTGGEFKDMHELRLLGLASNVIAGWEEPIFSKGKGPRTLNMKDNKISSPTAAMIQDFAEVSSLNMRDNPLACDCNLVVFLHWLRRESRFQRIRLDCSSPADWLGKSVWDFHSSKQAATCRKNLAKENDVQDEPAIANEVKPSKSGHRRRKLKGGLSSSALGMSSSFGVVTRFLLASVLVFFMN